MQLDIKFHSVSIPLELAQISNPSTAVVYAVLLDAANDNHIAELSRSEIARRSGIKSRTTINDIIAKLKTMGIVEPYYNDGYANRYYVKDILLENVKPSDQPQPNATDLSPAQQSDRQQPYPHRSGNPVWQAPDGRLKPAYKYYGKRETVALTDADYASLCSVYGRATVDDYIHRIELHCGKHNTVYHDYGATIADWIEKDWRKIKERSNKKEEVVDPKRKKELEEYSIFVNQFEENTNY